MQYSKLFLMLLVLPLICGLAFAADNITFANVSTSSTTPVGGTSISYAVRWIAVGAGNFTAGGSCWILSTDNGGSWANSTCNATFGTGNWSNGTITTSSTITNEGKPYGWRVYVNNSLGNMNVSTTTNWTIASVAPSVSITVPTAGDIMSSQIVPVTFVASDNVDTTLTCYWNYDGGSNNTMSTSPSNGSTYLNLATAAAKDEGTTTLYLYCNDNAWNGPLSGSDTVQFTVERSSHGAVVAHQDQGVGAVDTSTGITTGAFAFLSFLDKTFMGVDVKVVIALAVLAFIGAILVLAKR